MAIAERVSNSVEELLREARRQIKPADIDAVVLGQCSRARSLRQSVALVASQFSVMPTLKTGCGAAQYHRTLLELTAFDGDIPRGVAKAILLNKRRIMFLIDYDQPGST